MPSPRGIFLTLSQTDRDLLRAGAIARIASGDRTSMSALGKSSGKNFAMPPQDVLTELNYADRILSGKQSPNKIVSVLNYCRQW